MSTDIQLAGMDDLLNRLNDMGRKANLSVNKALEKGAQPILNEIQNTNIFQDRSGKLRKAQKVSKVKTRKSGKFVWVGDVDRKCPYAWPLEMGTSKTSSRPYMRNAWEKKKEESSRLIKEELRKGIGI